MPQHAASRQLQFARKHTLLRRILFTISVALSIVLLAIAGMVFSQTADSLGFVAFVAAIVHITLLVIDALGCLALVVFDYHTSTTRLRWIARATLMCLVATVASGMMILGFQLYFMLYVYQFICILAFQTLTDDQLSRNQTFRLPWDISEDETRRDYIPLNFFNIFWVFALASLIGLGIEVVYRLIQVGVLENRAGLLWGPFSPIYGVGAVLMTVVLNRYWNRSALAIFVVAGLIGAGFEWFASFFWENAFGVVAWDYSANFMNLQGRTDLAHALAWGLLGLVWIRIILPALLRAVDSIPLRWRATITTLFALFMLVDCVMTVMAIDSWYERSAGNAPSNMLEEYFAQHYDDTFMQTRFETMDMDASRVTRTI